MDFFWKFALFINVIGAVISVHLKQKDHDDERTRCHGINYAPSWPLTSGAHQSPILPSIQTSLITSVQNILGNLLGIFGSFHGWSGWSPWGKCSSTCGVGYQTRTRYCHTHHHYRTCPPGGTTYQVCTTPCGGGWSPWSSSPCSKSCGGGMTTKYRTCTNPIPLFGGQGCRGKSVHIVSCNTHSCAVNGAWSSWQNPSQCTVSCGGGVRIRTRKCNNPSPSHRGKTCQGVSVHTESCNTLSCPVNGAWSRWQNPSRCTVYCGGGVRIRTRKCNNPSPSHGGKPCRGVSVHTESCNTQACPAKLTTTMKPTTTTMKPTATTTARRPTTKPTTMKPTTTVTRPTTIKPTTRPSTTSKQSHYVTIKLSGKVGK